MRGEGDLEVKTENPRLFVQNKAFKEDPASVNTELERFSLEEIITGSAFIDLKNSTSSAPDMVQHEQRLRGSALAITHEDLGCGDRIEYSIKKHKLRASVKFKQLVLLESVREAVFW
ncbi:hypothetical protein E1301_Tti022271 [Triplophysa tibetana]|uniref:Uncharacterized protein n=1 Tax=Triplophysa tibetana TaxID=1572043 RepID=A0A5A9PIJ3_9TELE|nr:hypothetical protein E1301_Tti022271 [Triplophysa tibetana]